MTAFEQPASAKGSFPPSSREGAQALRLVVHIVNLQAVPGHEVKPGQIEGAGKLNWAYPIEEIVPARNVQLRIASPDNANLRVYLAPEGEELPFNVGDGWIRVRVPTVHYHAMVVVEGLAG